MYLDELPQLVNVLRGDMSLVGPRPWPDELVERQVARGVDYRLRVPAGWTGPRRSRRARDVQFEQLDLDYVALLESGSSWADRPPRPRHPEEHRADDAARRRARILSR